MPGTLESSPKLRWKLEAQDKVYVCVWGGVHFYDRIPSQTFHGELCLTISILQTTQWRFGELCPMRVLNLALKMTAWYYTVFLWHQNKLRNFLEGWFWLSVKCKLKAFGWVWLKGSYKPSLLGIAQRLWTMGGERGRDASPNNGTWSLIKTQLIMKKNLWSWTFRSFFFFNYLRLHLA